MERLFSNGPAQDYVIKPFEKLLDRATEIRIAVPYVTRTEKILQGAKAGKHIELLIGLNSSTSPEALQAIHSEPNIEIRYYTHRFHAKIYLFDDAALIGSSNLTEPGLVSNREATIYLDETSDRETIDELRTLFSSLWNPAPALTTDGLERFIQARERFYRQDIDGLIGDAVGRAEPPSITVKTDKSSAKRAYLERLRRQVLDYRKSFDEVTKVLSENQMHRPGLEEIGPENETNRFLNWVRLTYASGEDTWKDAPLRPEHESRHAEILRLGREWTETKQDRVSSEYLEWLQNVRNTFGSSAAINAASKEQLSNALMSIHAFHDRLRYKGGAANLISSFWQENNEDISKVKRTLQYLLYGGGEFLSRLHDVLYEEFWRLRSFGLSCSLELFGTVKPKEYPPVNFRIAKGLRYLGFNVIAE